jgi:hypothetical protein
MSAMTAGHMARSNGPEHESAVRRLAGARDEQRRLDGLYAAVAGTRAEPLALERLSAGRAYVASREAWLHWIDEGESLAPWADGEWAPATPVGLRAPETGRVGRELRGIQERAGLREVELARAVVRSGKRIRASERRIAAATTRRTKSRRFSNRRSSAGRTGRSNDA